MDDNFDEEEEIISDNEDVEETVKKTISAVNKKTKTYEVDEDVDEDDYADGDDDDEDVDDDDYADDDEDGEDENNRIDGGADTEIAAHPFAEIEDDDDDVDDDAYLQKFDESTRQNIISDFHPELQTHNYDEIEIFSRVVRDDNGIVIDPLHKTMPMITRYEKARILGERAKQINAGAKIFVNIDNNIIDGYLIALKEYDEKKIPFIVKRPLPNGGCEYWKFQDLEILA
jgi:DNA-directed RNA polymerase I, II, and III subunit RPABC2